MRRLQPFYVLAYYGRWIPPEQVRADCGVNRHDPKASEHFPKDTAGSPFSAHEKGSEKSFCRFFTAPVFLCVLTQTIEYDILSIIMEGSVSEKERTA